MDPQPELPYDLSQLLPGKASRGLKGGEGITHVTRSRHAWGRGKFEDLSRGCTGRAGNPNVII
jgi:hypothetical protein